MSEFLPVSRKDMEERGWDQCDFVYIVGDAYVDHPSFGHAIISRVLEDAGYKVGILSQPDWKDPQSVRALGEPRLGFLVTGGNMDSMVNHYSVSKCRRDTDAFTQYALAAAAEALRGGLPAAPDRMGIVMGTAMAGIATTAATQESLTTAVHKNVGPRFVPRILGNIAAAQIAMVHNLHGPSITLSTACASGGDAVAGAAMLLLAGEAGCAGAEDRGGTVAIQ